MSNVYNSIHLIKYLYILKIVMASECYDKNKLEFPSNNTVYNVHLNKSEIQIFQKIEN